MEDVVHSGHSALRNGKIGEVAFDQLDARDMCQVFALAGDEAVDDADARAAADEFLRQM